MKGVPVVLDYCVPYFWFCGACGHLDVDYSKTKVENELAYKFGWLNGHLDRWTFTLRLVPFSTRKLRVLDVGAAPGCLARMVKHLFGYEVYGLDSSRMIEAGGRVSYQEYTEIMEQNGIAIRDCDLDRDAFPFEDESFDVVLFTEVVEHLHEPLVTLSEIHRVLRTDSRLILSTPNFARVGNLIRGVFGKPKTFHGVREYTPRELSRLLEDRSFAIDEVRFSDWSERKYARKVQRKYSKLQISYVVWTEAKYYLVKVCPSLSSYVFIIGSKRKPS